MNKNYKFLILAISFLLLVSACNRGQGQPTSAPRNPFIGGTEGVVFDFERDAPPPEVTDSQTFPFNVILRLENKGEFEVPLGQIKVRLVGINPADFSQGVSLDARSIGGGEGFYGQTLDQDRNFASMKRTPEGDVIKGDLGFITFPQGGIKFNARNLPGNTEFTLKAEVCYKYQSKAISRLCILQNLIDRKPNALCNPNENKPVYTSASPVQVANFRQNVVGQNSVVFSFDIVHSGSGTIYKDTRGLGDTGQIGPGICQRDNPSSRRASIDKVYVRIKTNIGGSGFQPGNCNLEEAAGGNGFARLIDGRRTVTCNLDVTGQHTTDFESIVEIQLDYNYDITKSAKLLVKNLI